MRCAAAWLAALVASLPMAVAAETWTYGGELFAGHDTNAGNSGTEHERQGSGFLHGATSATWERRYDTHTALLARYSVALEQWLGLEQLTNARYAVRLDILHKPGRSFSTPVLGAFAGAGARHAASDIRSGFDYRAGLSARVPVTTRVVARAQAAQSWREATRGRAFDLEVSSYSLDVDWRLDNERTVYAGVRVDDGDFTVSAPGFGIVSPKDQHLYLEPRASAIDADPAFGEDWWAFRVDGRTSIVTLGFNVSLSPSLSLDAQVLRAEARMDAFTYERWVGSAGLLYRW
ncbi:MAG: hypothetical protein ACT4PK_00095 [Gammaproteobacteria bacterium]